MKGIAHFVTGVALATCFPQVVELARAGSLLPVLGGVGGILPDVLDFRFVRYFEHYDVEIDPAVCLDGHSSEGGDPAASGAVAAAHVADALAAAMRAAYASGESRNVIAHTLRLGSDLWRRYTIRLDPESRTLAVRFGPRVTTGGVTFPGTELPDSVWVERRLDMPIAHSYSREYDVDAFTGPSFRFAREPAGPGQIPGDGDVLAVHFLDWHHRWTHSLPLAFAVGLAVGVLVELAWGPGAGVWSGLLTALGFAAHVLEDQLGYMGSNLFWPFTRRRMPGLKLLHASEAIPNFLTVWTSVVLVLLNLDRFGGTRALPVPLTIGCAIVLPWLVLGTRYVVQRRRAGAAATVEAERLAEARGFGEG